MQNDVDANEAIKQHDKLIKSLARRLCHAEVDDLAQEGRIAMLTAIRLFDENKGTQLWTYARPFVLGAMLRFLLQQSKEPSSPSNEDMSEIESEEPNAEDSILETEERVEQRRRLMHALESLTEKEREIIFMRFHEERAFRAMADALGINVERVHTAYKGAIVSLRERAA